MEISLLKSRYIEQCAEVAYANYLEASDLFSFPEENNIIDILRNKIEQLSVFNLGVVAVENEKVIGYILGAPIEEFYGKNRGIYVPLYAHGAIGDKVTINHLMYRKFAKLCVSKSIFSHAITFYVNQKEVIDGFVWNGFGFRCSDAIRKLEKVEFDCDYEIREVSLAEAPMLHELVNMHIEFLNSSPLFMFRQPEHSSKGLINWMRKETNRVFGIYDDNKLVSYMKVTEKGETFIANQKSMANICGAYTLPEYRNKGLASRLVSTINNDCFKRGYTHLGVDFETFNYLGSRFWLKYFNAYTLTLVRRIDERSRIKF
ncbi:MAG: GNAT family N-acetyltransferase [Clostridia bacterium]|nr:GNAT family N-acetyltransferase [Clostridia bacterium]